MLVSPATPFQTDNKAPAAAHSNGNRSLPVQPVLMHEGAATMEVQHLRHLHNAETCFHCPQTFLSLDFQRRDFVN